MAQTQDRTEGKLEIPESLSRDTLWVGGAGVMLLLILAVRIWIKQGWRSFAPNGLLWLRLARSLLRFLQLATEISSQALNGED